MNNKVTSKKERYRLSPKHTKMLDHLLTTGDVTDLPYLLKVATAYSKTKFVAGNKNSNPTVPSISFLFIRYIARRLGTRLTPIVYNNVAMFFHLINNGDKQYPRVPLFGLATAANCHQTYIVMKVTFKMNYENDVPNTTI